MRKCVLISLYWIVFSGFIQAGDYTAFDARKVSPGNTTYYVDPAGGSDSGDGRTRKSAWKTFRAINALRLSAGDTVEVLAAGDCPVSLYPMGVGSEKNPIKINFAPGRYDFHQETGVKEKFHISNTNDDPKGDKAIALYFRGMKHLQVNGRGAEIRIHGRMIETCMIKCENVVMKNLSFDYSRPTVSEFTVLKADATSAIVSVHKDSTYKLKDGKLIWVGEGWESPARGHSQRYEPVPKRVARVGSVISKVSHIEEIEPHKLRLNYEKNPGYKPGWVYQFRYTHRDCVGVFMERCKDVVWKKVNFYFFHGMGVISQFCENLKFEDVVIAPREGSGRTCAAWADMLHFSGCKGLIRVDKVRFCGANDDAINVHGTHLRVVAREGDRKIRVRFMHRQTFGFEAFVPGDEIDFIGGDTLVPYATNKVKTVKVLNEREVLLTLEKNAPEKIAPEDVIENATWTADVHVTNCHLSRIPTRGFLLTTRGKVVIENNYFHRTRNAGILVADDARSWYESGYVRDMTIRGNTFYDCGAIQIHPENRMVDVENPVHFNIKITGNTFHRNGKIVDAKSTRGLEVTGNTIIAPKNVDKKRLLEQLVRTKACSKVKIERNKIKTSNP